MASDTEIETLLALYSLGRRMRPDYGAWEIYRLDSPTHVLRNWACDRPIELYIELLKCEYL